MAEKLELPSHLHLVQRKDLLTAGSHAFAEATSEVSRHEGSPTGITEVTPPTRIGQRLERTNHRSMIEHVAMALGGQERDLWELPRQNRVDSRGAREIEDLGPVNLEFAGSLED